MARMRRVTYRRWSGVALAALLVTVAVCAEDITYSGQVMTQASFSAAAPGAYEEIGRAHV